MKTIEEKAKAYDKVRKKIAIRFGSNVADEFFAEFEGSKDEEIRKALLEMVHDTTGDELWIDYNVHKENALAWLEKQGKKPAEWSEEDERMFNSCCAAVAAADYYTLDDKQDIENWLKSLKDRVGCEANCTTTKEWSEDDKRKIYRIYSILRQAADTHAFSTSCRLIGDKECMELQDWLTSLRPKNRWKPSDEQMEILLQAVAYFGVSWTNIDYLALQSLYFDLKKLKEEKV